MISKRLLNYDVGNVEFLLINLKNDFLCQLKCAYVYYYTHSEEHDGLFFSFQFRLEIIAQPFHFDASR